jgi:hypothetical protein
VLSETETESLSNTPVDTVRVGEGDACLGVETVVAVTEVAL